MPQGRASQEDKAGDIRVLCAHGCHQLVEAQSWPVARSLRAREQPTRGRERDWSASVWKPRWWSKTVT